MPYTRQMFAFRAHKVSQLGYWGYSFPRKSSRKGEDAPGGGDLFDGCVCELDLLVESPGVKVHFEAAKEIGAWCLLTQMKPFPFGAEIKVRVSYQHSAIRNVPLRADK